MIYHKLPISQAPEAEKHALLWGCVPWPRQVSTTAAVIRRNLVYNTSSSSMTWHLNPFVLPSETAPPMLFQNNIFVKTGTSPFYAADAGRRVMLSWFGYTPANFSCNVLYVDAQSSGVGALFGGLACARDEDPSKVVRYNCTTDYADVFDAAYMDANLYWNTSATDAHSLWNTSVTARQGERQPRPSDAEHPESNAPSQSHTRVKPLPTPTAAFADLPVFPDGLTLKQWRVARGHDIRSIVADPKFVDAASNVRQPNCLPTYQRFIVFAFQSHDMLERDLVM